MRAFILLTLLAVPAAARAADTALPCVRASNTNLYNAHAIGPHDIWIANSVGDRRPVRAATTCIHIRAESTINIHSVFQCVGTGDPVGVATLGLGGEQCRVTRVVPFVSGSEAKGYR